MRETAKVLLAMLDRELNEPLEVLEDWRGHTVWVFGVVGYRVDHRLRAVYPVYRDTAGRENIGRYKTELHRPLVTASFLAFVLRRFGLTDGGREPPDRRGSPTISENESRVAREAYRHLGRDPRFSELRGRRLPAALALDPVLCRITFLGRRTPDTSVASDQYTMVWRHERELRVAARENRKLLPLVLAALDEGRILPCGDSVKELHLLFRETGLSPATWRYATRHGTRFLRPLWPRVKRGHCTSSALEFLREIERAGHPPPPPDWFIEAWLRRAGWPRTSLSAGWNPVPPAVVSICLTEARRVRRTEAESGMWEDLGSVLGWATSQAPRLDKLQRRAGWAWLVRRAREYERRRLLLEVEGPRTWPFVLGEVVKEQFQAVPIDTVERLVDEGIMFHNCIADFLTPCQEGCVRLFVVRDRSSGRRAGVIKLEHQMLTDGWALRDVLGIGNAPVGPALRRFAEDLSDEYNVRMGGMPHEGGGWHADFGEELAKLEPDSESRCAGG